MAESKTYAPRQPSEAPWLTRGVLGIGIASLFSDMGHEAATSLLPILLGTLGAPPFALGAIEGVADGLSSFTKLAGGWLADRPAWRKPIAGGGYLITAVSTFLYGAAHSWPALLVLRSLGWAGRGAKGPSRDALLADAVGPSQLGRAFGFERAMDTAGAIVGPLLGMLLVGTFSIQWALHWTLLPGIIATLSFFLLVPAGKREQHHRPLSFFASLRRMPSVYRQYLFALLLFGLGDFAPTLLILRATQILGPRYGAVRAGVLAVALYTLHNTLYAASSYPAGLLGDRLGKRRVLVVGYLSAAAMSAGFLFHPSGLPALALLFCLGGVHLGITDAVQKSLAAEILPLEIRGTGFGVMATANGVGDFASSIMVGALWSGVGLQAGFLYAAVLTFAGAILMYRLPAR
jgi:MFS family permease